MCGEIHCCHVALDLVVVYPGDGNASVVEGDFIVRPVWNAPVDAVRDDVVGDVAVWLQELCLVDAAREVGDQVAGDRALRSKDAFKKIWIEVGTTLRKHF